MQKTHSQSGSVLVYILIAVALFAALSYAVASMMRGNDSTKGESATIQAGEILSFSQSIRNSVRDLMISNGCSDTQISFERAPFDGSDTDYVNSNAPSDFSCHVFHADGGGIAYSSPIADLLDSGFSSESLYGDWYFTGHTCIEDMGSADTNCHADGLDNSELIAYLPFINKQTCLKLNELLGFSNGSVEAPIDPNSVWSGAEQTFQGVYGETGTRLDGQVGDTHYALCFKSTSSNPAGGSYTFFQVLIPR